MKKYKVIVLPSAKADLIEARDWYKGVNEKLLSRFRLDVKKIVEILQERPTVFSARYREVRVGHLKVFPYALHYLLDQDSSGFRRFSYGCKS